MIKIKLDKKYVLNLSNFIGSVITINITALEFRTNGVLCKYNNYDKIEEIRYDIFEMNGYKKIIQFFF